MAESLLTAAAVAMHDINPPGEPEPHTWVGSFVAEGASAIIGHGALGPEAARILGLSRLILCLLGAAILVLLPTVASAGPMRPLVFGTTPAGPGNPTGIDFDGARAAVLDDAQALNGDPLEVCLADGRCDALFPTFYTLTMSPLLYAYERIDYIPLHRFYRYGRGTLSMDTVLFGAPLHILTATVDNFTMVLYDTNFFDDPGGPSFPHVWAGDPAVGEGVFAEIGYGALGPEFARMLGIPRNIIGGSWWMGLDGIVFDPPTSFDSVGADAGGGGLFLIVPEPAPLALLLAMLWPAVGRRRSSYAPARCRRR